MNLDFASLEPNDDYLLEVAENVWLMDNHKWALYVWECYRHASGIGRFTLVHADYHWDGNDDVFEQPDAEARLLAADLASLHTMVQGEDGVQYDSFIAPAVRRGMFDELHFFCKQDDDADIGIDEYVRDPVGTKQFVYSEAKDLAALNLKSPLIFDLCLDLFNKSDYFATGDIWPDEDIIAFMETARELVRKAALVTISLSFDYSGTEADTRRLASLVLPMIIEWRSQPAG